MFNPRAVMMANDMLKKKRTELKEKTEGTQNVEKQYVMMKKATVDLATLFKAYETDVSIMLLIMWSRFSCIDHQNENRFSSENTYSYFK
jgi:hypothetical protein